MKDFSKRWWLDVLLIISLAAFAAWNFWFPRQMAVNFLQEGPKFTIGAWYLYKTGRCEWVINHQAYPVMGSVGYALLLLPSFWLFGDFLGNAIYSQLVLGVLTCLGVYVAVRLCFGSWQGFVAGIVLASYPLFTGYSQMNDTSIAVAFFLTAGLLIFLKTTKDLSWSSLARWFLWGVCAGWAASIRLDSIAIFGLLTLTMLYFIRPHPTDLLKQWGAAVAGGIGPLGYAGWYNQHYCGSWLRDPHCFWASMPFDSSLGIFDIHQALGWPDYAHEDSGGNLVFYGREIFAQFGDWNQHHSLEWTVVYLCLTGLMIGGVGYTWGRRQDSKYKLRFLIFAAVATGALILFHAFLRWHIIRFIVPLAPVLASFIGVGTVELIQSLWRRNLAWIFIAPSILALVAAINMQIHAPTISAGDVLPSVDILQYSAAHIESNAVVISTIGPFVTDFFVIRGTQRRCVPLNLRKAYRVQPHPPKNRAIIPPVTKPEMTYLGDLENGAVDIFEFSALENPERIEQLLRQGTPVYLIDHTYGNNCDALPFLSQYFEMQSIAHRVPSDSEINYLHLQPGTFLWRLQPRQLTMPSIGASDTAH